MATKPVRRLVTGHDGAGRSVIKLDGPPPTIMQIPAVPGLTFYELWETKTSPADNSGDEDAADRPVHLQPEPIGSIFRILDIPPDGVSGSANEATEVFSAIGADHALDSKSDRNAFMHKTNSVDYAIVLSGEIWAVMDKGEVLMKQGDVLVQRGTNHAWSVRTKEPCRIAFILIGAKPR
jgi:mannose-6-phosphate isomerase-like protein (cupin superfamily)